MLIGCGSVAVSLQSCHSQLTLHARIIPNAFCEAAPEDEQVMLETCRGIWFSINWMKSSSRCFHYTDNAPRFKTRWWGFTDQSIIIIIIITTISDVCEGYLQLYTWNKTMFLGYMLLQLLYSYNLWYTSCYFSRCVFYNSTLLVLAEMCAQRTVWLLSVPPLFHAFPVCSSGVLHIILRWFQFLLSLTFLHSNCAVFLFWGLCTCTLGVLAFFLYHISVS
jgi:hypothetical protein